ncbi:hypothetical protein PAALTS15_02797 [Paenibacillus alvei TS-15]|jgi:hypothetical protein|uniref:Uncharacterized protein n=1 Tax=Paenibacillus alvei TS-15 TaxID=1117108 RepID=S9SXK7_PAEAL|nr:hypothetical protein [Paenibacillus alvei]EPY08863.1 hypothetical protein PAALTS15_02797 [Paenibacillus alvei TS-15]
MVIIEKIIHFVTSNPLIAIIILGALFSSLGGAKKKDKTNRMPDFSGGAAKSSDDKRYEDEGEEEYEEVERKPERQPVFTTSAERPAPAGMASSAGNSYDSIDSDEARITELEQRLAAIDRMASSISSGSASRASKRHTSSVASPEQVQGSSSRAVTPDEVMQGVIWAEVLGPPRAKRPYQQRR